MNEIDQENLDTAIALGDAVCKELGICSRSYRCQELATVKEKRTIIPQHRYPSRREAKICLFW